MNLPLISIIIPLYNKENSIIRTIQSIQNQSYQNIEIIVINDGSTDNSLSKVNSIIDSRLMVISQINQGVSAARNRGILNAKGEWLYFIDADDYIFAKDGFNIFHEGLYANANMIIANCSDITEKGEVSRCSKSKSGFVVNPYKSHYLGRSFFHTGNFIIRRNIAIKELFNENFNRYEDSDAYFRWASYGGVYYIATKFFVSDRRLASLAIPNQDRWNNDFAFHLKWVYGFWRNLCQASILQEAVLAYPDKRKFLLCQCGIKVYLYLTINKVIRGFQKLIRCFKYFYIRSDNNG